MTAPAASNREPLVLISGGGPAGLLASILLNDAGVSSVVLERADEPDAWSSKSYTLVLDDRGRSALGRGGCLESATAAGNERRFVSFLDGRTGETRHVPRAAPGLGSTRPGIVRCLEKVAADCPGVALRRGTGVLRVSRAEGGIRAHLDDGTSVEGTHIIGADGKWSRVRSSFPSLSSQSTMATAPSFGVSMFSPTVPRAFETDRTYVVSPRNECMFYCIASPHPSGGYSVSVVCHDETLERYPWLAPPADNVDANVECGWEDEHSAPQERAASADELARRLEGLFREEMPAFHDSLDGETFRAARVNRRVTWLDHGDGDGAAFSAEGGLVALIGDAAHAMTPSLGEGCNCALESAVRLADGVSSAMREGGGSTCSPAILSEAFRRYGASRPAEVIPVQRRSADRSNAKNQTAKRTTPTPKDQSLHSKTEKVS
mmetsp:Transcript_4418/g.10165  ORF Transcript_4418/g.10165 Transcript_4418/m.10165 type:complete len:433 (+) Transcript_4418:168-1466(+)